MVNSKEFFTGFLLSLLYAIIEQHLIIPYLNIDLFMFLPFILYPIYIYVKMKRELRQIVNGYFDEMGYSIISEKTLSWLGVLRNEFKNYTSFSASFKRLSYLDDFLRTFVVKNKEGESLEISVRIIAGWSWKGQIAIEVLSDIKQELVK